MMLRKTLIDMPKAKSQVDWRETFQVNTSGNSTNKKPTKSLMHA